MNTTLEPLATARAAAAAPRADLYTPIHKALRLYLSETLAAMGALDPDDDREVRAGVEQLRVLLGFMRAHLTHENEFIHPALEARRAGSSTRIADDHEEHRAAIDALAGEAAALQAAAAAERPLLALRLYRHLALFVAENLQHMHIEETAHNQQLSASYSDAELNALHGELLASIAPDDIALGLHWMAPALSHAELAGMLGAMQHEMPPAPFGGVLAQVKQRLSAPRWAKLAAALKVAP